MQVIVKRNSENKFALGWAIQRYKLGVFSALERNDFGAFFVGSNGPEIPGTSRGFPQ